MNFLYHYCASDIQATILVYLLSTTKLSMDLIALSSKLSAEEKVVEGSDVKENGKGVYAPEHYWTMKQKLFNTALDLCLYLILFVVREFWTSWVVSKFCF